MVTKCMLGVKKIPAIYRRDFSIGFMLLFRQ